MNIYYVYLLLDPTDYYKPFYVGKGKNRRMYDHFGNYYKDRNTFKHNKIAKIRSKGEEPVAIKWAENLSEDDAYDLEIHLIKRFGRRRVDPNGILTNRTIDSRHPDLPPESRKKNGDSQRGERNHRFGKSFTPEQREARSKIMKELGIKPPVRSGPMSEEQKNNIRKGNLGKKRSPEISAKLSELRRGKKRGPCSPETAEKIRQAQIGKKRKPWTPEQRIKTLAARAEAKARREKERGTAIFNGAPDFL